MTATCPVSVPYSDRNGAGSGLTTFGDAAWKAATAPFPFSLLDTLFPHDQELAKAARTCGARGLVRLRGSVKSKVLTVSQPLPRKLRFVKAAAL
jgi:hypothetical protein